MFKQLTLAGAALAMGATALIPATPAMAQRYDRGYQVDRYGYPVQDYQDRYYRGREYQGRGYQGREYQGRNRAYRNNNYRAAQKCRDGDGGTIVGAIAGGLAGNVIAGRGNRTLGTVLGGVVGAFAGREIDRSDRPNYCR